MSRDIRDLKLSKVSTGSGHQKYILHRIEEPGMSRKIYTCLKRWVCGDGYGAEYSSDQDCFRYGNGCGCAVDAMKWHEVVGCIAGDDTIMCAIRTVEDTAAVMDKIRKIVSREV